jgi:hypothetical protein
MALNHGQHSLMARRVNLSKILNKGYTLYIIETKLGKKVKCS